MQTYEFKLTPQNGTLELPAQFQQWNEKPVRVILLIEEINAPNQPSKETYTFDAISLNTKGFRFNREEANERYK